MFSLRFVFGLQNVSKNCCHMLICAFVGMGVLGQRSSEMMRLVGMHSYACFVMSVPAALHMSDKVSAWRYNRHWFTIITPIITPGTMIL